MAAYATEEALNRNERQFSVKIAVEGLPPELNTFLNHLNAARPNVMRFFNYGLPFKVKCHCLYYLRDPDPGETGYIG